MLVVTLVASTSLVLRPIPAEADTIERVSSAGESTMLDLINGERTSRGQVPLRMSSGVRQVARDWSRTMAEDGVLKHRQNLSSLFTGSWSRLGENVGVGGSVRSLHDAFMKSSGHRANVLNSSYRWVGIGVVTTVEGRTWVTVNFGAGDDSVVSRFQSATSVPSGPFRDVSARHPFTEEIAWLRWREITKGCNPPTNDRFCPDSVVTRQQMATFLVRALGLPPAKARFTDVPAGSTHAADIGALAAAGITDGCGSSGERFCPRRRVTRQQMATFLVRAFDLPSAKIRFDDVLPGSLHAADIAALSASGITKGCARTLFCPGASVTRKHMAAFLYRAPR